MCGKDLKKVNYALFGSGWGENAIKDSWGFVGDLYGGFRQEAGDLFGNVGLGFVTNTGGLRTEQQRSAADAEGDQKKLQRFVDMQYAPHAPEKSAMEIYDAEGVRNRRRRAALMGINQLKMPSGPGTASGGSGYGGVGGATY